MPFRSSGRGAYGPQGQRVLKGPLAPVWTTFSPPSGGAGSYSYQFVATDDSGDAPTYSLASGSVPTGLTLSSSGLLSGTPSASGTFTFNVRATDVNGRFTDSGNVSVTISLGRNIEFILIAGGGSGGNGATNGSNCSGGAGAGGFIYGTATLNIGTAYPITIGAGGTSYNASNSQDGFDGSASTFNGLTAVGGGRGGGAQSGPGGNGGSGGGGGEGQTGGSGTGGQGNNGGFGGGPSGGGGAGGRGFNGPGSGNGVPESGNGGSARFDFSTWASATGTGVGGGYAGGGGGGVGSSFSATPGGGGGATAGGPINGDSSSATPNTGSGSGAAGTQGAPNVTGGGGSGICIIRYSGSQVSSGGSVNSSGGFTYHTFFGSGTFTA